MSRILLSVLIALAICGEASAEFFAAARFLSRPSPITDEQGRIRYIVDFAKPTYDSFSDHATPEVAQRFQPWKSNRSKNFARSLELQYGITVESVISYVGPSIAAYLTVEEMERLRRDPRVILVTEVSTATTRFSGPPWSDSSPVNPPDPENYGMTSWGHVAVNGLTSTVGSGYTKIYVVDSGVAYHNDLSNVTRVNPWGTRVVGCYAHATQVASIINATAGNTGTVGILPGVPIVSVSVHRWTWDSGSLHCSGPYNPLPTSEEVSQALDYVYWDIRNNNGQKPGIVNLSMNSADMGHTETVGAKMKVVATPEVGSGYVYFGGFIAQSAGNNNASACDYAYNNTTSNDGIMVVGGIDQAGEDVAGTGPYVSDWAAQADGSNYGSCVEVWAPSKEIYGAWGQKAIVLQTNSATWTLDDSSSTYNSAAKSGGTSFAAPHVAAIAAHLQKTSSLGSSMAIETAVRNTLYTATKTDQAGNTIYYATIP